MTVSRPFQLPRFELPPVPPLHPARPAVPITRAPDAAPPAPPRVELPTPQAPTVTAAWQGAPPAVQLRPRAHRDGVFGLAVGIGVLVGLVALVLGLGSSLDEEAGGRGQHRGVIVPLPGS